MLVHWQQWIDYGVAVGRPCLLQLLVSAHSHTPARARTRRASQYRTAPPSPRGAAACGHLQDGEAHELQPAAAGTHGRLWRGLDPCKHRTQLSALTRPGMSTGSPARGGDFAYKRHGGCACEL